MPALGQCVTLTADQAVRTVAHMDSTGYAAAVADNVHRAIAGRSRSVLSVAEATGIPRTTLDRRLRSGGASPFSVSELKAIADELGITVRDLTTVYADQAPQAVPA